MNAAILAIPNSSQFAFAAWLGGAGLSVCGVFIVQYFPIKAFSITDEDIGNLVGDEDQYALQALLAIAIASPVIIALWSSILFAGGIFDYVLHADLGGPKYKALALVPLCIGVLAVLLTLVIGERIGRQTEKRYWIAKE